MDFLYLLKFIIILQIYLNSGGPVKPCWRVSLFAKFVFDPPHGVAVFQVYVSPPASGRCLPSLCVTPHQGFLFAKFTFDPHHRSLFAKVVFDPWPRVCLPNLCLTPTTSGRCLPNLCLIPHQGSLFVKFVFDHRTGVGVCKIMFDPPGRCSPKSSLALY